MEAAGERVSCSIRIRLMLRAVAVTSFLIVWFASGCSSRHPTDQTLIDEFQSHKPQYKKLLEMFLADKDLGRVAYDFTRPEEPEKFGITQQRLQQYRDLF